MSGKAAGKGKGRSSGKKSSVGKASRDRSSEKKFSEGKASRGRVSEKKSSEGKASRDKASGKKSSMGRASQVGASEAVASQKAIEKQGGFERDELTGAHANVLDKAAPDPFHEAPGKIAAGRWIGTVSRCVADIYVLLMICIFPLYTHNRYYDVLESRFSFFWITTISAGVLMLLLYILRFIMNRINRKKGGEIEALPVLSNMFKLRLPDIPLLVLILLFLLSMALSGYPYETWWGNRGRYMGVLFWLCIGMSYILVTRFYEFKKWHVRAFLFSAGLACLWGITDFLYMDVFHYFENIVGKYRTTFMGPIGNINSYTSFTLIPFAIASTLFILEDHPAAKAWAFFSMFLSAFGCVTGLSDNAFLSVTAVFAILPLVTWKKVHNAILYIWVLVAFLFVMVQCGDWTLSDNVNTIVTEGNIGVFVRLGMLEPVRLFRVPAFLAALFASALHGALAMKKNSEADGTAAHGTAAAEEKLVACLKAGWLLTLALVGIAAILLFLDANLWKSHPDLWGAFENIFVFSEEWGTGRGFAWRMALSYFVEHMGPLKKLFGYGPDSYYMITMDNYFREMINAGFGVYDSAHNEYLNFLLTVGIAGLAAYLCYYGSLALCLIRGSRDIDGKEREGDRRGVSAYPIAFFVMLVGYAAAAIVNITVPIVYPILSILAFQGISCVYKSEKGEKVKEKGHNDRI